ncbi:MAG: hypothetical protein EP341_03120 [Sphingomonadales bacterium]|nr:MAG: hypothetical protein EP341_03120 [Sphingomonadales bacterium]
MNRDEMIALAESKGIVVDKRWGDARLKAALEDAGEYIPEGAPEPDPEPVEIEAPKPKADGRAKCLVMCKSLHIRPKDLGLPDSGMSRKFAFRDRLELPIALAQSLAANGQVEIL